MMRRRSLLAVLALLAPVAVTIGQAPPGAAATTERWNRTASGGQILYSSPVIADINGDGSNDTAVGSSNGLVYAYDASGNLLPGWPANAGVAIASSPAVADLEGDGSNELVVGLGTLDNPGTGGVAVFNKDGSRRCIFTTSTQYGSSAVFNSPAIGDVNGDFVKDIVFGSFDHHIYAINKDCGLIASYDNTDTVWSAPALYDIDGGGMDIFIGGDATASSAGLPHAGGYYRSLKYNGTTTLAERWVNADSSETIQSGTAIGDIDGDGRLEAITGTGADYCRNHGGPCTDSNKVWAFHLDDGSKVNGWPKGIDAGYTTFLSAPAIGDINGDGKPDVVVGGTKYVNGNPSTGELYAFLSSGGHWTQTSQGDAELIASPVIADTDGSGTNEVVFGVSSGLYVLNGPDGGVKEKLGPSLIRKSAAAIGMLGSRWAMVSAGTAGSDGHIYAYDLPNPQAAPWPLFEKNARRTGSDPNDPQPIKCPAGVGYYLAAADGGIFAFGDAPFFGSTGNIHLNQPIVGMTATPSRKGYEFVARDGGIFSFGDAKFQGSTGNIHLNQPIVGMATTPTGNGYWLVASDGGIFSFGDAKFQGSTGAIHLNQPIVGMASTPSGAGYWLVARDGGIFSFGDAKFQGSTGAIHLNQPIVGMSRTPSGSGYWFVASDGGIFSFGDAKFQGSTGNIHLNLPVVGMRATPSGSGYWFVASDGGIFSFGDALFCGSTGNIHLNQPIVGMG